MKDHRAHGLVQLTFRNPASVVYLSLVTVAALFVTVDMLFVTHDDASLAGVWLFLLAAPTVFLFMIGGDLLASAVADSAAFLYPSLVLSVLIQSYALGLFVRLLRGERRAPSRSVPGSAV
ncbi:SCO4225 family membrane protein [Streptomyces sp. NPDC087440]|uniref:SCO4225 family membrane protein n=1 Tax=Streptomyces sp. NPDC087440 TaxID=3365790 RepID=UPI0037F4D838